MAGHILLTLMMVMPRNGMILTKMDLVTIGIIPNGMSPVLLVNLLSVQHNQTDVLMSIQYSFTQTPKGA